MSITSSFSFSSCLFLKLKSFISGSSIFSSPVEAIFNVVIFPFTLLSKSKYSFRSAFGKKLIICILSFLLPILSTLPNLWISDTGFHWISKFITVSQSCKFCPSEIQSVPTIISICSSCGISIFILDFGENALKILWKSSLTFLFEVFTPLPVTLAMLISLPANFFNSSE